MGRGCRHGSLSYSIADYRVDLMHLKVGFFFAVHDYARFKN